MNHIDGTPPRSAARQSFTVAHRAAAIALRWLWRGLRFELVGAGFFAAGAFYGALAATIFGLMPNAAELAKAYVSAAL